MDTTLTTKSDSIKAKRISKCALTHQQSVEDVMGSLVIDKQHDHLAPIVENVVRRLVLHFNEVRLQRAATSCVSGVERCLNDTYSLHQYATSADDWQSMWNDGDCCFHGLKCDSQGNLLEQGSFEHFDYADQMRMAEFKFDADWVALDNAVREVNNSSVFKTAGVMLIATSDLLVYGGSAKA